MRTCVDGCNYGRVKELERLRETDAGAITNLGNRLDEVLAEVAVKRGRGRGLKTKAAEQTEARKKRGAKVAKMIEEDIKARKGAVERVKTHEEVLGV